MKVIVYKACVRNMLMYGAENLESRGVSEVVSHREKNAENDLRSDVEG